jgi:hypothetical protein
MSAMTTAGATGGAQPAFRIEKKYPGRDDLIAFGQPVEDFHPIGQPRSECHAARLEAAIADSDENMLFQTGIHYRVTRYQQRLARRARKCGRAV